MAMVTCLKTRFRWEIGGRLICLWGHSSVTWSDLSIYCQKCCKGYDISSAKIQRDLPSASAIISEELMGERGELPTPVPGDLRFQTSGVYTASQQLEKFSWCCESESSFCELFTWYVLISISTSKKSDDFASPFRVSLSWLLPRVVTKENNNMFRWTSTSYKQEQKRLHQFELQHAFLLTLRLGCPFWRFASPFFWQQENVRAAVSPALPGENVLYDS